MVLSNGLKTCGFLAGLAPTTVSVASSRRTRREEELPCIREGDGEERCGRGEADRLCGNAQAESRAFADDIGVDEIGDLRVEENTGERQGRKCHVLEHTLPSKFRTSYLKISHIFFFVNKFEKKKAVEVERSRLRPEETRRFAQNEHLFQ